MTKKFPSGAKAENSQNVLFPKNSEEILMESISKSFETDSWESILKQRHLV